MSETVLVTGSTGFIGRRLLRHLAEEGNRVRVFLRPESNGGDLAEGVEVVRGSFEDRMLLPVPCVVLTALCTWRG